MEKLPEGLYLATSEDIQGLVAQGRTVAETMEIARDAARRLLEAQIERKGTVKLKPIKKCFVCSWWSVTEHGAIVRVQIS